MNQDLDKLPTENIEQLMVVVSDLFNKLSLMRQIAPISVTNPPKGVNKDEHRAILLRLTTENYIYLSENEEYATVNRKNYDNGSFIDYSQALHEEYHKRKGLTSGKEKPSYDSVNGILYLAGYKIKIKKHDENTKQNQLLDYIFNRNAKELSREFDFTEFPFEDVGDKKKFKEICRTACTSINDKIAKETNNTIADFLEFNTLTYGFLKINPKYL